MNNLDTIGAEVYAVLKHIPVDKYNKIPPKITNIFEKYKDLSYNIQIDTNKNFKEQNISYAATSNSSDIQLMARAINGEARGEPYEGQVAVGAVILNRVKDSKFPNTIAGVIYEPGAFTAVADGQINVPISEGSTVVKAARDAINGWDPTGGAIYYYNPATATNKWIWSRTTIKVIGKHKFCK